MGRVMVWAMKRRGVDGEDGEVGWRGVSSWRTRKTGREKEKEERERQRQGKGKKKCGRRREGEVKVEGGSGQLSKGRQKT